VKHQEDATALAHTKLLYDIINKELKESVVTFKDLISHNVITFEYLWALFTPEDLIKSGKDRLYRLKTAEYKEHNRVKVFTLSTNFIDWDGTQFGYDSETISISAFDGTRPITDLEGYPVTFDTDLERLKASLILRGKKFEALRGAHYMAYAGLATEVSNWLFGNSSRNVSHNV
jgi:hypothetical protein